MNYWLQARLNKISFRWDQYQTCQLFSEDNQLLGWVSFWDDSRNLWWTPVIVEKFTCEELKTQKLPAVKSLDHAKELLEAHWRAKLSSRSKNELLVET